MPLPTTLHYRNRGQIFKIGVNFFKSRQGKKWHRHKLAIFCPAFINFVDCREIHPNAPTALARSISHNRQARKLEEKEDKFSTNEN